MATCKVIEYKTSHVRIMFLGQVIQTIDIPRGDYPTVNDMANYIPLLRPSAQRVLLIGLGGGSMVKTLNGLHVAVDAVEIDPMVAEAAKRFFGVAEGPLCRILEQDGRSVLNRCDTKYDALVMNAFAGGDMPPHLASREAFTQMKGCLAAEGLLMVNCISSSTIRAAACSVTSSRRCRRTACFATYAFSVGTSLPRMTWRTT